MSLSAKLKKLRKVEDHLSESYKILGNLMRESDPVYGNDFIRTWIHLNAFRDEVEELRRNMQDRLNRR